MGGILYDQGPDVVDAHLIECLVTRTAACLGHIVKEEGALEQLQARPDYMKAVIESLTSNPSWISFSKDVLKKDAANVWESRKASNTPEE